ncbi:glycosyltransferase family 2 protein [Natrononativus amylolyticus]|uniref:glycosyltransferase family 2 protein n=1 Tax=Natrononativus amylolyticus TaxID=2963434 RepID=UPI0020CEE87C|nr:glycosyltransferase family 2 protein [Natrononativus amylolyticus]
MRGQRENGAEREYRYGPPESTVAGIVASSADGGTIDEIGQIRRAKAAGYDVLVALSSERSPELARFARLIGAQVVDIDLDVDDAVSRDVLAYLASQQGYSSITYPDGDAPTEPIDPVERLEWATEPDRSGRADRRPPHVVAIPAYNEAGTIAEIVESATAHADRVLVIDDGSVDETAERAREAGATVIRHDFNMGYGAALKTAFDDAARRGARSLVTLDGDGQHDAVDIPVLREALEAGSADVVIGSRFVEGAATDISPLRRSGLWLINVLTNVSLGYVGPRGRISDTQSGFRAYSGRAVRSLSGDDRLESQMGASTDILYHARKYGYEIEEVGTSISYDVANSSSQGPFSHGMTLVTNIAKTAAYQHPVLSLGLPGLVSVLIGLWLSFVVVVGYLETGTVGITSFIVAILCGWFGAVASITAVLIVVLKVHGGPK